MLTALKDEVRKQSPVSQDEIQKCHQLFRLTKGGTDDSYEWYKNRVEKRLHGTCEWFLNQDNFQNWLRRDSGLLIVSADPGCGKSVLAKFLIDDRLAQSATVCYFFFKDQDQNTIRQALCALLHQLFSYKPSLIRHAIPEYQKNGSDLVNITTSLWDIFEKASKDTEMGSVIFILDALDECINSDFNDLVTRLKNQFQQQRTPSGKVRFLLTSRPYGNILSEFQELVSAFPCIRIPGEDCSKAISQEVNCVIKHRVKQLAKEKNLTAEVEDHLEQQLLQIQHRTYLWVYLVFDFLKSQVFKKTKKGIESLIATLPRSVAQAYESILGKSKDREMVFKTLCIVLVATRPLALAEMNIAINIDDSSRAIEDLDLENEDDFKERLRFECGLFVSIYDKKVYFLHQTAREFLLQELCTPEPIPLQWYGSIRIYQAQLVLAKICVTYLALLNAKNATLPDLNGEKDQYIGNYVLIDYTAKYWAYHFREAHVSADEAIIPAVLKICDPDSDSYKVWLGTYWTSDFLHMTGNFTAILIAVYFWARSHRRATSRGRKRRCYL